MDGERDEGDEDDEDDEEVATWLKSAVAAFFAPAALLWCDEWIDSGSG